MMYTHPLHFYGKYWLTSVFSIIFKRPHLQERLYDTIRPFKVVRCFVPGQMLIFTMTTLWLYIVIRKSLKVLTVDVGHFLACFGHMPIKIRF